MLHEILGWLHSDVLSQPAGVLIALLCLVGTVSVLTVMFKERQFKFPSIKTGATAILWLSPIVAILMVLGTRLFPFFVATNQTDHQEPATRLPWEDNSVWTVHTVESWSPVEDMDIAEVQKRHEGGQVTWRVALESEQHTSPADARDELTQTVLALVTTDLQQVHPEISNPTIPESLIRERSVLNETLTNTTHELPDSGRTFETTQIRWVVELNSEVRDQIRESWEQEVVTVRAGLVAGGVGFLTFLFGLLATYLRVDHRTNGEYRGRLKLGLLSLAIAGGLGFIQVLNMIAMDPLRGFLF